MKPQDNEGFKQDIVTAAALAPWYAANCCQRTTSFTHAECKSGDW